MKKSKIIAPALGVLVLSTAAAVTGTVAWFTANRTVSIQNTAITAFNPEEGLKVTLSGASGCNIVGTGEGSGSTPAAVSHELLRDASVDLGQASPVVYRAVVEENESISGYATVATPTVAAGTTASGDDYYYVSIYTAKFELDAGESADTYDLKLDPSKLDTHATSSDIAAALRIGIWVSSSTFKVIAPFSAAGNKTYVNGTTLDDDDSTYTCLGNDSTVSDAFKLGELSADGHVDATIYTWFEGTDAACVNDNVDGEQLQVDLGFSITKQ